MGLVQGVDGLDLEAAAGCLEGKGQAGRGAHHRAVHRLADLDVHVGRLREKLDDDAERPRYVMTVRGVGYRAAPQREA